MFEFEQLKYNFLKNKCQRKASLKVSTPVLITIGKKDDKKDDKKKSSSKDKKKSDKPGTPKKGSDKKSSRSKKGADSPAGMVFYFKFKCIASKVDLESEFKSQPDLLSKAGGSQPDISQHPGGHPGGAMGGGYPG